MNRTEMMYEMENLQKSYRRRMVLNIKKLKIQKGEITSLIGPSGAGKTTLLNLLGGIEAPDAGTISYEGKLYPTNGRLDISVQRELAMVFQKPVVFNRSIQENIAYGLKLRKTSKEEIHDQVTHIAERIGLSSMLKHNARTLSGGEMQRVALARAIVLKPRVLFLDESTTNLDPANVAIIEELVRYANQENGTTVILATHNLHQAKRLSGRCIFLLGGELVEEGETQQILVQSQNKTTQAFLDGEMIC